MERVEKGKYKQGVVSRRKKGRLGRLFTRPDVMQKGKDLETLCSDDQKYKFQVERKEVP